MVHIKIIASLLVAIGSISTVNAGVKFCKSNTKGKCPGKTNCQPQATDDAIQAAECSHNPFVSGTQTFAVFRVEHQYDKSHGAPYGSCAAYTCTPPTDAEMTEVNDDCWTFFWEGEGESEGTGTGCIRSPINGNCGCETAPDGTFHEGPELACGS